MYHQSDMQSLQKVQDIEKISDSLCISYNLNLSIYAIVGIVAPGRGSGNLFGNTLLPAGEREHGGTVDFLAGVKKKQRS